jgi:hypothetical protein
MIFAAESKLPSLVPLLSKDVVPAIGIISLSSPTSSWSP